MVNECVCENQLFEGSNVQSNVCLLSHYLVDREPMTFCVQEEQSLTFFNNRTLECKHLTCTGLL